MYNEQHDLIEEYKDGFGKHLDENENEVVNKTSLIKVKPTTGNTKSAKTVLGNREKYRADQLIKFGEYNIGRQNNTITLPYYLAFLID